MITRRAVALLLVVSFLLASAAGCGAGGLEKAKLRSNRALVSFSFVYPLIFSLADATKTPPAERDKVLTAFMEIHAAYMRFNVEFQKVDKLEGAAKALVVSQLDNVLRTVVNLECKGVLKLGDAAASARLAAWVAAFRGGLQFVSLFLGVAAPLQAPAVAPCGPAALVPAEFSLSALDGLLDEMDRLSRAGL